jgi:drug/metabolite transporter (DMT)-like permease
VNPAIAAVLGWWVLDEQLGLGQIAGIVVMFAGVALVSWPGKDKLRLDPDEQKDPSTAGCG